MVSRNSTLALILVLALTATTAARATETTGASPSPDSVPTVTVTADGEALACTDLTPDQARHLAEEAEQNGEHQKAAHCFRIAGDHVRADRAQLRASAVTGAVSSQKTAAHIRTAKAQAKRLKDAFK